MAVDHTRIARLLKEKEETSDHSLRSQSLDRAVKMKVPATLTPYEWQQWYAEHGIPESHLKASTESPPWWHKLLRLKRDS